MSEAAPFTPPSVTAYAAEPDHVIYKGPVSLRVAWTSFLGCFCAITAGLVVLGYGIFFAHEGPLKTLSMICGAAGFISSNMMLVYLIVALRMTRYTITTRMIERERGIVVRRTDSFAMARVKDIQLQQTVFERILRIGSLRIISSDAAEPDLLLEGIPNSRTVYEQMRDVVIRNTEKRGIVPLN